MDLDAFLSSERLPAGFGVLIDAIYRPLADWLVGGGADRPALIGICGPQGSGKSTAASVLRLLSQEHGLCVAVLSLDDLYLGREQRAELARSVHPLLATRGPPGTHDLALGQAVINGLLAGEDVVLPSFDKATDDPRPAGEWPLFHGPADIVLFEGWCVGARPQAPADLTQPVNDLERLSDPDGIWRRFVNQALAAYQPLFDPIDRLIQFRPPDFGCVVGWRQEQEAKLRVANPGKPGLMTDAEVERFVQHYERLTREIMREMPARANALIDLGSNRELAHLSLKDIGA